MEKIKNLLSGKGFWAFVFLLVLIIAIPVTITLLKQQQTIKSQAASDPIKFSGSNVKVITDAKGVSRQIATLEDINVEITVPSAAPTASPSPPGFNLNGSVNCSSGATATFRWDSVTGASNYVVKYLRDSDGEWVTLDAATTTTKTVQLSNGPFARWSVTVNYSDDRAAQTKTFGEGFTCSGGSSYSQSSYSSYSQSSYSSYSQSSYSTYSQSSYTSGQVCTPGVWSAEYCGACKADGTGWNENTDFGDGNNSNTWCACAKKYRPNVCQNNTTCVSLGYCSAAASYSQSSYSGGSVCTPGVWSAEYCGACKADGTGWNENTDFGDGNNSNTWCACAKKYRPNVCQNNTTCVSLGYCSATSSNGALGFKQLIQKFLPKEALAQTVPAACNVKCSTPGSTEGCAAGYVCVDDAGDKQCRGIQCPANSNCECMAGAAASTPPTQSTSPSSGSTGGTVPAGVTFTNFKVAEKDDENAWSLAPEHPITTKRVSYKFIPQVCVTQPCDTYPRGLRRVYVQFIGKDANNQDYTQVFSKDIMLALKPVAQSVSCEVPPSGVGSVVTIKGLHFGDEVGAVTVGEQLATIAPTDWSNLQAVGNTSTTISSQTEVTLTTVDGQKTSPLKCTPGQTTLEFKAQLTCGSTHKTISTGDLEIREKASTVSATPAVSVFKKAGNPFSDGKPSGLNTPLIEGKEYELVLKAPNSLQRVVPFKAGKGTTSLGDVDLPMGDIESERGDCVVNNFDRSQLLREWTRTSKTTTRGDFDQNGQVNSIDHACLNSNFNKRCE